MQSAFAYAVLGALSIPICAFYHPSVSTDNLLSWSCLIQPPTKCQPFSTLAATAFVISFVYLAFVIAFLNSSTRTAQAPQKDTFFFLSVAK